MNFERIESCEPNDENEIIGESSYVDMCIDYALKTGWVRPEQKNILVEQYLKPIYQKYIVIINEVKKEVATETEAEKMIGTIIKRLGHILERTQRIGSTDHNNITRGIYDYRDRFCQSDAYLEYAATSLADFIFELLNTNN